MHFPLFAAGALSPLNELLDIAVAWALTRLLGWHRIFLPSFVAELVPGVDLVPSWRGPSRVTTKTASVASIPPLNHRPLKAVYSGSGTSPDCGLPGEMTAHMRRGAATLG